MQFLRWFSAKSPEVRKKRLPRGGHLRQLEHVIPEGETGQRLAANVLEQREVLLASLERLFHRDHAVPEHACLAHQFSVAPRSVNATRCGRAAPRSVSVPAAS